MHGASEITMRRKCICLPAAVSRWNIQTIKPRLPQLSTQCQLLPASSFSPLFLQLLLIYIYRECQKLEQEGHRPGQAAQHKKWLRAGAVSSTARIQCEC